MGLAADVIVSSARMTLRYAEGLPGGIGAADFGKKVRCGDMVVEANTPAFVYGHLSLYPSRVVAFAGGDASAVTPSDAWVELFQHGAVCRDDPEGAIYPAKDELVDAFLKAQGAAIEAAAGMGDDLLAQPNPNEGMREKLPTIGDATNFYLCGHAMMHLGQVSFWRRAMGLGSLM